MDIQNTTTSAHKVSACTNYSQLKCIYISTSVCKQPRAAAQRQKIAKFLIKVCVQMLAFEIYLNFMRTSFKPRSRCATNKQRRKGAIIAAAATTITTSDTKHNNAINMYQPFVVQRKSSPSPQPSHEVRNRRKVKLLSNI
ncbi:unnamed protein product [Ceratitis capitata]|uniref:(Mediterranean fruit fly) hypothetical protein n=1 Tax=Ceratitis capitata TaxID=7213 RepID=A0A811V0Y8_CERCA|nr:unnamed protein product [Ceratitis capitata]